MVDNSKPQQNDRLIA